MDTVLGDSRREHLLRLEQTRLLYAPMPVTLTATAINACVLLFFEWPAVDHHLLLIWFILLQLTTGLRLLTMLAYFRASAAEQQELRWERHFLGGALSAAILWGCASFVLFPPDSIIHQVFLAFIVAGMAAGSVTSLAPRRLTVMAFLVLALAPLSLRFFMVGSDMAGAMGGLTLFFLLLVSANALKSHQNIVQNILLRLESGERENAIRQSEQRLRESEQTYHGIFNSLQEAVYIQDEEGRFLDINEGAVRMYGYPRERFIGQTPAFLSAPGRNDLERIAGHIRKAFSGEAQQFEFWGIDASGRAFPKEVRLYPGAYFGRDAIIAIAQDISDKRDLESRLVQSQKMEAIGRLVGGIAHDFNNTLAAIMGNLHIARLKIDQRDALEEKLDNINELSAHAAAIVQQLLTFARRDIVETSNLSLTSLLREQVRLADTIIPRNIELSFNICDEDLHITGNPVQLQQVLMNLLNNARDALTDTDKPEIICTLELYTADHGFRTRHPKVNASQLAHLSLADNGSGMSEEVLQHIFEPFFTTKDTGKGTGLGLAMAYGAIETHHGVLEVKSQPGKGTTFHIYLPLVDPKKETAAKAVAIPDHQEAGHGHGEAILLADDEEALTMAMKEVLNHYGYHVLTAGDGQQAIDTFASNRETVDLIILDLVMPRMDGDEAARRIRNIDPEIPIIFITGYDKEYILTSREQLGHSLVLRKPIPVEMLSNSINRMLG